MGFSEMDADVSNYLTRMYVSKTFETVIIAK